MVRLFSHCTKNTTSKNQVEKYFTIIMMIQKQSKVHKAHFNLVGINHKQLVNLCENLLNSTEIVQEKFLMKNCSCLFNIPTATQK